MPRQLPGDGARMIDCVTGIARRTEAAGLHSLWVTDAFMRGSTTLDPYTLLGALCAVTRQVELSSCIIQLPIRHPVEHAHRVQAVNLLSNGRFLLGIGSGSTRADFDAVQADFESRFKTMPAMLEAMRRTWRGESVYGGKPGLWPGTEGGPPVLLGAWHTPRWIAFAAEQCQGWIASGIRNSFEDAAKGLRMYRAAGGKRAVMANIFMDLRQQPQTADAHRPLGLSLICTPAEARDRLRRLEDLGFDDAAVVVPADDPEQIETIAGLI
jgi:alkanesulfonate monooxygenase SsuD/methylene tetrahydromethanopterin reductase-like flavin-dependent oxidoreductase (luciferase family)